MKKILKKFIHHILRVNGWKLIKIRKPPEPNPYGKLDENILKTLNNCSGILHLGAHRGTEAEVYNWFGINVIWIEAVPKTFEHLVDNLYFYKNQIALQALLTDKDDQNIKFNISNYDAACSSIFQFTEKIKSSEIWSKKDHKMLNSINLKSSRLDTLLQENNIKPENYNHWILDLQGAELLALKGGEESLDFCNSIYIEVSKINVYSGGVHWNDLKQWLIKKNFQPLSEPTKDEEDILFVKK